MTDAFLDTIYLFQCSARGLDPVIDESMDFESIYLISRDQNIWPSIFAMQLPEDKVNIPKPELDSIKNQCLKIYVFQHNRRSFMKQLYEQFDKNQIVFCLLKGESLAQFYKEPLLRLSSDVDIIIHKNDIEKVIMLLKENEYEVQPLKPGGHHFKCFHKIYGLLEVHVSFYMDVTNDICFKNLIKFQEDYREIQIPEIGNVHVLGYTDGLLYLLIHFIKHFISFGAGIRHVMDIAFYLENYYENIDMKMIKKQLEQVGYADFLNYVLFLCSKYLNSEVSQRYIVSTHEIEQKADIILDDMERGGVFGHKDLARVDFYKIYLRERAKRKNVKGKLWKHMVSRIAPPQKGEESTICYIGKLFTLYPATMVYRGFSYLKRYILKRKVTNTENADSTLKRMELLEELGLI